METNGHKEAQAWARDIANATAFLTRLPIPAGWQDHSRGLALSARAFPLVGLLIGTVTAVILLGARAAGFSPLLAALIAVAATALLTGALHEDGLADMADGFGGGHTRERKLEIMHDSGIGAYGVLALVFTLLIKTAAASELAWWPVVLAAVVSRTTMVWLMWVAPHARSGGLSVMAGRPDRAVFLQALIITVFSGVLLLIVGQSAQAIAVATVVSLAVPAAVYRLCLRQIGGQSGDVCGGLQLLTETALLAVLTLWA